MVDNIEWKEIPLFEGRYEVSSSGEIRSLITVDSRGNKRTPNILAKYTEIRNGAIIRQTVTLMHVDGSKVKMNVHKAVVLAFIGDIPKSMVIRHLDGNPTNNNLNNLRIGTYQENSNDQILHGSTLKGKKNPKCILSEELVIKIKTTDFSVRGSQVEFSKDHSIKLSTINAIIKGRIWSWLLP